MRGEEGTAGLASAAGGRRRRGAPGAGRPCWGRPTTQAQPQLASRARGRPGRLAPLPRLGPCFRRCYCCPRCCRCPPSALLCGSLKLLCHDPQSCDRTGPQLVAAAARAPSPAAAAAPTGGPPSHTLPHARSSAAGSRAPDCCPGPRAARPCAAAYRGTQTVAARAAPPRPATPRRPARPPQCARPAGGGRGQPPGPRPHASRAKLRTCPGRGTRYSPPGTPACASVGATAGRPPAAAPRSPAAAPPARARVCAGRGGLAVRAPW